MYVPHFMCHPLELLQINTSLPKVNPSSSVKQSYILLTYLLGWIGSRVVSVLDSDAKGPVFKLQPLRCQVTVLGKLFTPIVPLFTKQQNW